MDEIHITESSFSIYLIGSLLATIGLVLLFAISLPGKKRMELSWRGAPRVPMSRLTISLFASLLIALGVWQIVSEAIARHDLQIPDPIFALLFVIIGGSAGYDMVRHYRTKRHSVTKVNEQNDQA